MRQYGSYKPINLPWLREIPTHWTVLRNKNIFTEMKTEVGERSSEYTLLSLTLNGIIPRDVESGKGKFPEKFDKYKIVEPGNMAFCLFDIDETPRTVGLSSYAGMLTGAYTIMKVGNINSRWVYYYYLSLDNVKALRPLYSGLRKTINVNTFQGTKLPIPPRSEQDQIVRYLDWQVSKINKLIAAKKKEIALLQEIEQSIVVNVITKGCNERVPRKASGINWIEEIPSHWNVLFLSQVATEQAIKNTGMIENNLLSLSYGRVIEKDINTTDGLLPTSFEGYQIVYPGNIILRLTDLQNDHKSLRTGLSRHQGIITSAYTCLKVRNNILSKFLRLQLHAADLCKVFYGMGGGVRQSLSYKDIRRMLVFVPELKEQADIVTAINNLCSEIKPCCDKIETEISTLEELKKKLISDVVTGQIDVRDIKIPDFKYVDNEYLKEPSNDEEV